MKFEQILQLIDHVSDSKVTSFQYEEDGVKLSMKCGKVTRIMTGNVDMSVANGAVPESVKAVETAEIPDAEATAEASGNLVKSPLVGTFYSAPSEEAEPFVKVGDRVKKGQILAIVEAMKLMNEIESDFDGEVVEIYAKNAQAVEYGQPLFRII